MATSLDQMALPPCHTLTGPASRSSTGRSPSPDLISLQKLVQTIFRSSTGTIRHLERLPSSQHRLFYIETTDGHTAVVKCLPGQNRHFLRHEQHTLETESRVLTLIASNTDVPTPRRLRYDSDSENPMLSPFLVRSHVKGVPVDVVAPRVASHERDAIDASIAHHLRQLSSLAAPSFGPTSRVFNDSGSATWREAFLGMLESVLRDCEDLMITVPYDLIRQLTRRHASLLDDIREARFVALDAGLDGNVLIDESTRSVVGLLGFSNVLWGDPFMATIFLHASEAFWHTFGSAVRSTPGYQERVYL
jgi:hypothetical protein